MYKSWVDNINLQVFSAAYKVVVFDHLLLPKLCIHAMKQTMCLIAGIAKCSTSFVINWNAVSIHMCNCEAKKLTLLFSLFTTRFQPNIGTGSYAQSGKQVY